MNFDEMEQKRQENKAEEEATAKTAKVAARGVADYFTGGKYEQIRNMPGVNKVADKLETTVGKVAAKSTKLMPGGKGLRKSAKKLDDAGVVDTADQALGVVGGSMGGGAGAAAGAKGGAGAGGMGVNAMGGKPNPKDVDAVKNRGGVNTADHSSRLGGLRNKGEEGETTTSSSGSSLDKKDGLGSKGLGSKDKNSGDSKDGSSEKKGIFTQQKEEDKETKSLFGGSILLKRIKMKIIAFAIVAGLAAFSLFFCAMLFMYAYDSIVGSITSFFGIKETKIDEGTSAKNSNGFFDSEKYMINPDTGEEFTQEELVAYLKENREGSCGDVGIFGRIMDWIKSITGSFNGFCGLYRHIFKYLESQEQKYSITLDKGLILSSMFYGYAHQPDYFDMDNPEKEDITNAYSFYDALEKIIEDGDVLNIENVETVIDSTFLVDDYDYYTWAVRNVYNKDGELVKSVGYCDKSHIDSAKYSSLKWKMTIRFGEEAATLYELDRDYNHSFGSTSDECKMGMSDAELLEIVRSAGGGPPELDSSVHKANDFYENRRYETDLSPFEQKADIENEGKDTFSPYSDADPEYIEYRYKIETDKKRKERIGNLLKAEALSGKTFTFDYIFGFAYKFFPAFEKSYKDPNIELEYDEAVTPKQIEQNIEYMMYKKKDINENLYFDDLDSNEIMQLGDYVIGENCEGYLTAAPDSIQVNVTDCDGGNIRTTTFKDYIMGVAYGEVSDSGDNYVLSEMVAAITYALHRRNNYAKGNKITMRSGNCDQVYCPMNEGCYGQKAALSCGSFKCTSYYPGGGSFHGKASASLQEKYSNYYEEAKNYLIVSNGKVHSVHYVSSIQLGWKSKAKQGMHFTQILQETYGSEGAQVIQCSGTGSGTEEETETTSVPTGSTTGTNTSSAYPEKAPNLGRFYGFSYNDAPEGREITINPDWKNANLTKIRTNCSAGGWDETYTINKNAASNFSKAYQNMCKLLTTGVTLKDGTHCQYNKSYFINGGTFVSRKMNSGKVSLHAYGLAQDWNYTLSLNVNGKSYKPYATQGASQKAEYDRFVAALGKEEHCSNVNYILWKYAFEPAGFNWGGNWSASYWDGMHFEVKY